MTTFTLPAAVAQRLADKHSVVDTVDIRQWPEYKQSHPGLTFTGTFDQEGRAIWMTTNPNQNPFTFAEPAATSPVVDTAAIAQAGHAPTAASPSTATSPTP